ncbi:hypothetical protein C9374_004160 [Naegleria lovaniensis]|uniref:Uncharacterized protein n=1 Tax=Naegleria lovaniensis TaxID=51637 RepID=A0AA88GM33_NAELO|nr:uncharacterized protein C9374_004160 [Naegleria lovaniensis]KAG2383489.1 hypothetical protein C9374_004160 [Naegleria lovaniensis]
MIGNDSSQQEGSSKAIPRRKKWFYFIQYFLLFILFAHGIRSGFFTLLNRSQFKSGATNTFCSRATPESVRDKLVNTGHKSSETDVLITRKGLNVFNDKDFMELKENHHLCEYPPGLQFSKVIWFFTDGLPVKYSKKTFDHFRDHMVLYTIDVPGPKYSHAIYTSYMTGQLPTNYQGHAIEGDSLVKSMQRSPSMGPLTYIGPEWSFLAIHGSKNYDKLFKRIVIKEEPLDQPHDQGYRFFFSNEDARKFYHETLDTIKAEGGSLFTHSAIFDHINHGIFRHDPTNLDYLNYLSDRIASDINPLKDWIDANPDYLLILSSDHGTDDVSNGYVLHGYSRDGNEGYVMLYNPRLKPYEERLDIVDVCPTVAKFLKDVDIPADNIGVSRAYFGGDDESLKYRSYVLKESLVQLTDTTTRRGTDLLRSASSILNLLKMELEDLAFNEKFKNINEFNDELSKLAVGMKRKLYQLLDKPVFWVFFYGFFALAMVVIGLYRFNFHAIHLMAEKFFSKSLYLLGILVPLYFGSYVNILFCWDTWKNVVRSGSPFFVWQGFLTVVLFFVLYQCAIHLLRSNTKSDKEKPSENFSLIGWKMFIFCIIDMTFFALYNLFRRQWKWGMEYILPLQYFALIHFVCDFCGYSVFGLITSSALYVIRKIRRSTPVPTKKSASKNSWFHFFYCFAMMMLLFLFEYTSVRETAPQEQKALYVHYYTIAGFHIYYLAFLIMAIVYTCFVLLFNPKRLDRLLVPAILYAFALMRDTPYGRVVTLLQNIQYCYFLVPAYIIANKYCCKVKKEDKGYSSNANSPHFEEEETKHHFFDLLQLVMSVFFLNHFMYGFHVGKEERLDVDAHPMAGAVGMKSHQQHPNFNAFQMGYERWHMALICTLYFWSVLHREKDDTHFTKSEQESKDADRYYVTDVILNTFTLMVLNAHVFVNLMLCYITMDHAFQETIVYLIVIAVSATLFTGFNMITRYSVFVIEFILSKVPNGRFKTLVQQVFLSQNEPEMDDILPLVGNNLANGSKEV